MESENFHYYDLDKNGFLSFDEFVNIFKSDSAIDGTHYTDDQIKNEINETIMKIQDLNKDGQISFGENEYSRLGADFDGKSFTKQQHASSAGLQANNELFEEIGYDQDHDEKITLEEIKAKDAQLLQDQKFMQDLKALDTDHDGFISKEELNSATQSIKDKCVNIENLNKYGKISIVEVLLAENGGNDLTKAYLESKYGKGYAQMLLNKYDNDNNGVITSKELETNISNGNSNENSNGSTNNKSDNESANNKSNGISTGAIIGIIIGAVVLVGLIVGLIIYFSRKKKEKGDPKENAVGEEKEEKEGEDDQEEREHEEEEKEGNSFEKNNKKANYKIDSIAASDKSIV